MIRLIFRKIEIFLILIGVIGLLSSSSGLYKTLVVGVKNVTHVEQLEENVFDTVIIESPIKDSGYTLDKIITDTTERYFYLGQLGDSPIFLSSTSKLDETESTTIVGYVTRFYNDDNYSKLEKLICEDLKIDHEGFNAVFSPYLIVVGTVGENAQSKDLINTLGMLIFSVGIIIAGVVILNKKKQAGQAGLR